MDYCRLILAIIALVFSGCRKEADYHPYIGESDHLAYDSYSSQFEYPWKCLSSGYVFWDVDDTDWDAVYEEYMPTTKSYSAKTTTRASSLSWTRPLSTLRIIIDLSVTHRQTFNIMEKSAKAFWRIFPYL